MKCVRTTSHRGLTNVPPLWWRRLLDDVKRLRVQFAVELVTLHEKDGFYSMYFVDSQEGKGCSSLRLKLLNRCLPKLKFKLENTVEHNFYYAAGPLARLSGL